MVPSVQLPTWAIPAPVVVCAESVTEALAVPAGQDVTSAPLTGLPLASRTITEGATATAVPAAADCWLPALTAIALAGPAVRVIALDVRSDKPGLVNRSVRVPTAPVILRSVNDATPEVLVLAVSIPPKVPPPDAIAAVITLPAWLTLLPAASWSWTTGCGDSGMPICAVVPGGVVRTNLAAGPAVTTKLELVTGARPGDVATSV